MSGIDDRALDEALARWAQRPAGDRGFAERMEESARHLAQTERKASGWLSDRRARWATAVAAAAVVGLLAVPGRAPSDRETEALSGQAWMNFVALHVPTVDEEWML